MQSFERVESSFKSAVRACIPPRITVENAWLFALNCAAAHHSVTELDIVRKCRPRIVVSVLAGLVVDLLL